MWGEEGRKIGEGIEKGTGTGIEIGKGLKARKGEREVAGIVEWVIGRGKEAGVEVRGEDDSEAEGAT